MSNLHRIQWIDAQIRAKRFPNSRIISEHFEISGRQASRDIEYLRYSMGAPLEYSSDRNGYYYSNDAFTLPQFFIGEEEKKALVYLADQYSALKSTQAAHLAELFNKLTFTEPLVGKGSPQLPVYDVNPKVVNTYGFLKKAIEEHTAVEITYINPGESGTTRIVSPYKLFSRKGKNYVVGFCELRKDIRVFRLDRILKLLFTKNSYTLSPDFNENEYGEESSFNFKSPYTCTITSDRYIHFGKLKCTMEHTDKYLYEVDFYDSEELVQLLLSQPCPFTIVFPRWLRNKLKERLNRILEQNI